MTLFEGMCFGFAAGMIATMICILLGALINEHNHNTNSGGSDLPVGDRDRSGNNGSDIEEGGNG